MGAGSDARRRSEARARSRKIRTGSEHAEDWKRRLAREVRRRAASQLTRRICYTKAGKTTLFTAERSGGYAGTVYSRPGSRAARSTLPGGRGHFVTPSASSATADIALASFSAPPIAESARRLVLKSRRDLAAAGRDESDRRRSQSWVSKKPGPAGLGQDRPRRLPGPRRRSRVAGRRRGIPALTHRCREVDRRR